MKKYLSIAILLLSMVVSSGCSFGSSDSSGTSTAGSIWKSGDGGKTWEVKNKTSEKINLSAVDVLSMAVNPYDAKNILVGTMKDGILATSDGGESWTLLNFQSEKVYGLDIDNMDGRIVYASGVWQKRGKIFKSSDSGNTWQEIYTAPSAGPLVISLTLDKKNSNIVYATTSDNQVMKSTDAGGSWKNIYQAPSPVLRVVIDSVNDNLIYFNLLTGGLFRSSDGGSSFTEISKNVFSVEKSSQGISIVETDPSNANIVYVAGAVGMLQSKDAGNSWQKIKLLSDSQAFPVKALAVNPRNPNEIIYGASQATYKSVDAGASWTTAQFDTAKAINILKYNPSESNVVYMGLSSSAK